MTPSFSVLTPAALFFAALALLTVWSVRRARKSQAGFSAEYFLANRSLGGFVLAMTVVATYGSVSTFVSGPGIAWNLGLGWVVFAAPQMTAGFLLLGILGKKLALVSRALGSLTLIDVLRRRYDSDAVADLCAAALLVFFTAMMTGQFAGGAWLLSEVTGTDYVTGLAAFGLLTLAYTAFGGFRAVAVTDTLCALLMLLGMGVLALEILSAGGGMQTLLETASKSTDGALGEGAFLSPDAGGALPWPLLFSAWILVGFGTVGLPQTAVRAMSYRTTQDLHRALTVSTWVCGALFLGMTFLGVLARGLPVVDPASVGANTDRLMPLLLVRLLDPWVCGVTLIGPLAATMSTVSSLLLSASSAVVEDVLLRRCPDWSRRPSLVRLVSRTATAVLGLIALLIAVRPPDLVAWISMAAFGGLETAFVLPLVLGLFWRRASAAGACASIAGGLTVYLGLLAAGIHPAGFHPVVPAMATALVLFVAGSLLFPGRRPPDWRKFFPD